MTLAERVHLHYTEAYICTCGIVGNSAIQCACGQEHGLQSLQSILDRVPPEPRDPFEGVRVVWSKGFSA